MKTISRKLPGITLAAFFVMLCAMFALTRSARSAATPGLNPAPPIARSTDGGVTFLADPGVLTPGSHQLLRVTVVPGFRIDDVSVRLRWEQYAPQSCSGVPAVCRHMVVSQGATPPETLGPNDALSSDVPGNGEGMRLVVVSNSKNATVKFQILDATTGSVSAIWQQPLE